MNHEEQNAYRRRTVYAQCKPTFNQTTTGSLSHAGDDLQCAPNFAFGESRLAECTVACGGSKHVEFTFN